MGTQEAVLDLTIFKGDGTAFFGTISSPDVIVEPGFQTPSAVLTHDRPYLKAPRGFSATEVNFFDGSTDIGSISVGVLDKRTTATDQTSGILTAQIKNIVGKRAVLRRWVAELSTYITIFEGIVYGYTVDEDDLLTYWLELRDTREFERNGDLFSSNYVLWGKDGAQGPAIDYGKYGYWYIIQNSLDALFGGDKSIFHMIPAVDPFPSFDPEQDLDGEDAVPHFHRFDDGDPDDGIFYGFAPIKDVRGALDPRSHSTDRTAIPKPLVDNGEPTQSADGTWYYRDLYVRWRAKGTDDAWTVLHAMPRAEGKLIVDRATETILSEQGGPQAGPGIMHLYFGSTDAADLPSNGQEIEFQVIAEEITEDTPFFWDGGTLGDLLTEIANGDHTDYEPQEQYDTAALAEFAANTPRARFILREPVTDRRAWVQEHIYRPAMYAPGFGSDLKISPVSWEHPDNTETVPELNADTVQPVGTWEDSIREAVGAVRFTYIREHLEEIIEEGENKNSHLHEWERLVEKEVEFFDEDPDAPPGAKTLKYKPVTIRSFGEQDGAPRSGDVQNETGHRLATRIFETLVGRVRGGALRFEALVTSTATNLQRVVGDWVSLYVPWLPDYATGKRGARRFMQIYSIADEDPSLRRIKLQDGGVKDPSGDTEIVDENQTDCLTGGTLVAAPDGGSMRIFEADGTLENVCGEDVTIRKVLLIGGGGGGGGVGSGSRGASGGGGAGGVEIATDVLVKAGESIPVTVGDGGAVNTKGEDSVLWVGEGVNQGLALDPNTDPQPSAHDAEGGGEGGEGEEFGGGGGSGGGGGTGGSVSNDGQPGGSATGDEGNDGGRGRGIGGSATCFKGAGGGGGSYAAVGEDGEVSPTFAGDGGASQVLSDFGIEAGGGGQGGAMQEAGATVCGSQGEFTKGGASGSGYGAGGGGGAWNDKSDPDVAGKAGSKGIVAVLYAGGVPGLSVPTISSTDTDDFNRVEICITDADWPVVEYDGYRVRVEYAVTASDGSEPDADSGEWQLAGYLEEPGCVKTNPVPTGSKVWPRAIAEATDFLPSAPGGGASAVQTDQTPALIRHKVTIDRDTGIATVTWDVNEYTDEVEIRAHVGEVDDTLPDPLPLIATVDADLGEYELTSLVIGEGQIITVDLTPKPVTGTIEEDTDGQVAHHIAGDADVPFSTGDWQNEGGIDSIEVDATTGNVRFESDEGASWRTASYSAQAAAAEMMVRSRSNYNVDYNHGPATLVSGRETLIGLLWRMGNFQSDIPDWILRELDGGTSTNLAGPENLPTQRTADTFYWGSVWAKNDGAAAIYDFLDDLTLEVAAGTHGIGSGRAGFFHRGANFGSRDQEASHFYLDAGRYLTVTGLSTGQKAKVVDASDTVLAEATESGGTATVDLLGVKPTEATKIVVTDSGDSEVATLEPSWDYIAGGSTATFTAGTAADGPTYRLSRENVERESVSASFVTSQLDRLTFDDDLNLSVDDDLNLTLGDS